MNLVPSRRIPGPRRLLSLVAATLAVLILIPGTAVAAAAADVTSAGSGPYRVHGSCTALIGYVSDFNEVTYVVEAEGTAYDQRWMHASSTELEASTTFSSSVPTPERIVEAMRHRVDGVVAVATSVSCEIYDTRTGQVHGRVAGGLPGPTAAAAGTVTAPLTANVAARVCVSAIFADGTWISSC